MKTDWIDGRERGNAQGRMAEQWHNGASVWKRIHSEERERERVQRSKRDSQITGISGSPPYPRYLSCDIRTIGVTTRKTNIRQMSQISKTSCREIELVEESRDVSALYNSI